MDNNVEVLRAQLAMARRQHEADLRTLDGLLSENAHLRLRLARVEAVREHWIGGSEGFRRAAMLYGELCAALGETVFHDEEGADHEDGREDQPGGPP